MPRTLIALAIVTATVLGTAAPVAGAHADRCDATVVTYTETRIWVPGHYEWNGSCHEYVAGHWQVTRTPCEPPPPRVVVVREPACERAVVVREPACEPVLVARPSCPPPVVVVRGHDHHHHRGHVARPRAVVVQPEHCPPPRRGVSIRIGGHLPVPVPVPVPVPFPFRHR